MFFLCLMLGVIVILIISADFSQTRTNFNGMAAGLAQGKMAEAEMNPRKMLNTQGIFDSNFSGYTWRIMSAGQEIPIIIFADRELRKVIVEVSLNEEYVYTLEKYIFIYR